jgi:DNA repair exonuclease SbcCD ATPase subunit
MEPVEIDFVVNANDSEQRIGAVRNSIAGMGTAADEAMRRLKDRFAEEAQALKQVELDIKNIEKAYSRAAPGAAKIELGQELAAAKKALQEQKVIVADLKGQVDAAGQAHVSFRTQLRQMREELIAMAQAGQAGTAAYEELQRQAAELEDAIGDVSAATRTLANDQSVFQGVVSGLSGIAGGMSAAAGAAALFGVESEDLARIQTRLQSLMAITVGLQQVSAALNKDSAFQLVVVANAKRAWAAAVQFLNVQLGISVGLSKALMASGIGLLLAGVGLLVSKIIEWRKSQQAAKMSFQNKLVLLLQNTLWN